MCPVLAGFHTWIRDDGTRAGRTRWKIDVAVADMVRQKGECDGDRAIVRLGDTRVLVPHHSMPTGWAEGVAFLSPVSG